MGELLEPATISPCTFTMDHNAIICFMTDGLMRGPDKDVHVPSVGSQKYPSYNVDGIYSYLTIGGVVWDPTKPLRRLLGGLG
ncbi:unnamed protein product [Pelagomonas calceolata]|uniref:Uncharacterized protein n=1 Tax=Pelagomonas calceolata TaxID=35677 RepID=A0A8J2SUC9_9STRA|nr:unnamed protein product [Pelagomonas calceolata]